MSPTVVIIIVLVVLIVAGAIAYSVRASRRKRLQQTFGPEYDRVVGDAGSRAAGEQELRDREKRHAELELKALSAESKARYSVAWEEVQIQFVDEPKDAVSTADELVTSLMGERGYPTGDYDEQVATLSVRHAKTLEHYRDARAISERNRAGDADTEDLRQALVHYRALFADLLGENPVRSEGAIAPDSEPKIPAGSEGTTGADSGTKLPAHPEGTTAPGVPSQKINNHDTDVADSHPDAASR